MFSPWSYHTMASAEGTLESPLCWLGQQTQAAEEAYLE